jgi:hypothetical protein
LASIVFGDNDIGTEVGHAATAGLESTSTVEAEVIGGAGTIVRVGITVPSGTGTPDSGLTDSGLTGPGWAGSDTNPS